MNPRRDKFRRLATQTLRELNKHTVSDDQQRDLTYDDLSEVADAKEPSLFEDPGYEETKLISYAVYCGALDQPVDNLYAYFNESIKTAGILDRLKKLPLTQKLVSVFAELKGTLQLIAHDLKIGIDDIIAAFKQKDIFNLLKAFGFNALKILQAIKAATRFVSQGLLTVFEELHRTKVFKKIQSGVMRIDQVLEKYPIIKRVTGIALAGLMIWMTLNSVFIGDTDADLDISSILAALHGSFSLADLIASPSGLLLISSYAVASFTGISFPWLGSNLYNLLLALLYTAFKKLKANSSWTQRIRSMLPIRKTSSYRIGYEKLSVSKVIRNGGSARRC